MVKTKEILKIVEEEDGLALGYDDFHGVHPGIFIRGEELDVIGIQLGLTHTEERCILAEELGHYFTLPPGMDLRESHRYGILQKRVFYETIAREYAANLLIPQDQWEKALEKKDLTIEEIMTTFDVTEDIACYRLDMHFLGMVMINPNKHRSGIPKDRLEEEYRIYEKWLSETKEQLRNPVKVA